MDNKFLTFIKPYLAFIDDGHLYRKPFSWLYAILAILNLIIPFAILFQAIDKKLFSAPGKFVIVFILMWFVILFVSWISFQLWWDRKAKVTATSSEGDDFVATPVFAHFIQTLGEWIGTWIGVVGFAGALLMTIILGNEGRFMFQQLGIGFIKSGILFIVLMPVYGFLIIVAARFMAEQFRALAAIANNTSKK